MLSVPRSLVRYLHLDGPPLPLIDGKSGQAYMLMPVRFERSPKGGVYARVPGVRAVGEADQPTDALTTLAIVIHDHLHEL